MECSRCGGCMILEGAVVSPTKSYERFDLYKCIQCGESIDSVILDNRLKQRGGLLLEEKVDQIRGRAKAPRSWF